MESSFETQITLTPEQAAAGGTAGLIISFIQLVIFVLMITSLWKVYAKAGKPGWAAIVPIYNIIVWLQIIGRPLWWIALILIPFVNIVIVIVMSIDLAKAFGKSTLFGVFGLFFFAFIGYPILAFSDAKYNSPVAK
jgi:hypothetical protein